MLKFLSNYSQGNYHTDSVIGRTASDKCNNNNHFIALCPDYPGEPVPEETLTHTPSWSSSNLYQLLPSTTIPSILPVQITGLVIFLHEPLSMSSLVYLLLWSPPPHIPYISSPNQCLLFATHAHTIATCFAVVSILLWPPCIADADITFLPCGFFYLLSIFFPCLISAVAGWMSAILAHMVWP